MTITSTPLKFSFNFTKQFCMFSSQIKPQIIPFSSYEPIDSVDIFGNTKPLNLEIGTGNGEFIVKNAMKVRNENFLGFEIVKKLIVKTAGIINRMNLLNVRLVHYDALFFIKMFKNSSIKNIYINFPDPWPKRKHNKRRIITIDFLKLLYDKLEQNGLLYIVTDFEDYGQTIMNNTLRTPFKSAYNTTYIDYLDNYFETKYYKKFAKEKNVFFFKLIK